MKIKYLLFFLFFFAPIFTRAEIIISEIAWMGTSGSANEEWIEIQNTGGSSINLTGWKLYKAGGNTQVFSLSGNIASGEYILICRTTPSVTNPLSGICDLTGTFGGGALNNSGEHFVLRDGNGTMIQDLNFSSGWPSGNNSTKETMQWNGSIWITAPATPGTQNAMFDSGTTGNQGTDGGTNEQSSGGSSSGGSSGGQSTSSSNSENKKEKIRYDSDLVEIQVVNSTLPVGTPVKFSLKTRDTEGVNIIRGNFFWNMGDGTEYVFNRNESFEHFYEHEGTYVVSVRYYSTYFEGVPPNATHRITLNIIKPGIVISHIHLDGGVELRNTTGQEIDLSGWVLRDNTGNSFTIPKDTYIPAGRSITFNPRQTKMNAVNVMLLNPMNKFVSFKEKFPSPTATASSIARSSTSSSGSSVNSTLAINNQENIKEDDINTLNDLYMASVARSKQKQPSFWIVVFVIFILSVSVVVYLLYKRGESDEESKDDFELLD